MVPELYMKENKLAVISFSGGLDSTSLLINLLTHNYKIFALSFDYGQKHKIELVKAQQNIKYLKSKEYNVNHKTVNISSSASISFEPCPI